MTAEMADRPGPVAVAFAWVNLAAAFVLELAALVALGYAAAAASHSTPIRIALAVGVPLAAALLWGIFAAPRAPVHRPMLKVAVKSLVFGGATVGLAAAGHPVAAAVFGLAVAVNLIALRLAPPVSGQS